MATIVRVDECRIENRRNVLEGLDDLKIRPLRLDHAVADLIGDVLVVRVVEANRHPARAVVLTSGNEPRRGHSLDVERDR